MELVCKFLQLNYKLTKHMSISLTKSNPEKRFINLLADKANEYLPQKLANTHLFKSVSQVHLSTADIILFYSLMYYQIYDGKQMVLK